MIGAGQFAKGTLLPAIKKVKIPYDLIGVATASGHSGKHTAKKFGFNYCTTNYKEILNDKDINLVLITTKHGLHAKFVIESLKAGKDVFVEKPLCLNEQELNEIIEVYNKVNSELGTQNSDIKNSDSGLKTQDSGQLLAVGFNRSFSPYTKFIKKELGEINEPIVINCRVNAGYIPKDSWVNDRQQGGGRIIGEVCHFVDLIQYLSDSLIEEVYAVSISGGIDPVLEKDNLAINLKMENGSVGNIVYVANGDKSFSRERVEIFGKRSVGVINNFKSANFTRNSKIKKKKSYMTIDRGHTGEMESLFKAVKEGKNFPVSFEKYVNTTLTTFRIENSLKTEKPVKIEFRNTKD